MGKTIKLMSLLGGGMLAFGGGAAGTHFAYPYLEKKLNPEREAREVKMKQSFDAKNKEVESIGRDLENKKKENNLQRYKIDSISQTVGNLSNQINEKDEELLRKGRVISEKNSELEEKNRLNQEQQQRINSLSSDVLKKEKEIETETEEKKKVKGKLDVINGKLALTKEEILTVSALEKSSLNVNVRKIKRKEIVGEWAVFETLDYLGQKKEFKVKKPSQFANYEAKAKQIKTKGITFGLSSEFKTWNKSMEIVRYDIDYGFIATNTSNERAFVKQKDEFKFKLTDYFQEPYLEDAFRVFMAISNLELFPFKHDLSATTEKRLVFYNDLDIQMDFLTTNSLTWGNFKETDEEASKIQAWTNMFVTVDDFINYWTKKTVEFIRTGTVDLFDFLNPILLSENYRKG